jgi:hypothetical protein
MFQSGIRDLKAARGAKRYPALEPLQAVVHAQPPPFTAASAG